MEINNETVNIFNQYDVDIPKWVYNLFNENILPSKQELLNTINYEYISKNSNNKKDRFIAMAMTSLKIADFNDLIGFTILNKEFIQSLSEFFKGKRVLEICAGSGFLSKYLEDNGIDIITTDNHCWELRYETWKIFKESEDLSANDAIEKYNKNIDYIILSYPPLKEHVAADALKLCIKYNIPMIYIGEDEGGNCANDDFFELKDSVNSWTILEEVNDNYVNFMGDHCQIFIIKP